MSAIPTTYDGYTFRSRLEARWACFFNHMRMEYQYEPEAYEFPDGTRYLPDFYLPVVSCWAEVKPEPPNEEEEHKANLLADESQKSVFWLIGLPEFKPYCASDGYGGYLQPYSLDIYAFDRHYYDEEHRFYADHPLEYLTEKGASVQYRNAVYACMRERFNQWAEPRIGHEPFNLTDREMEGK